ncbi:MAG TPA: phage baseplate assembly protein V [Candidatus Dormibacteraeota bacterium]|nr:phage baseplate assembly protein V [Candidatus Dormibacteraeota bacterium]
MSLLLRDHALPMLGPGAFVANVVSVKDPDGHNRVQVRVYDVDGVADQDATVWARVAVPFAGNNRGAFFMPDVGDEVLVVYLSGDPRFPVVIGGLWNGHDSAPDAFGGSGESVDRWTITGTLGTKIAIVEDTSGPTISFTTPGGLKGTLTDSGGGSIELINSEQTSIKIDSSGVTIDAPTGEVQVTAASSVSVTAPQLSVSAAMATFSGVVQCQVMQATTVIGTTYTPGAGNVW